MPTTVLNALRRFILAVVMLATVGLGIVANALPAQADSGSSPHASTTIVDVAFVAKNSTWMDEHFAPQKGDLYGNVQVSGIYVDTDGSLITAQLAVDPTHWRAKEAIKKDWADIWLEGMSSPGIEKKVADSLKLGKIRVDSITVTDSDNRAGADTLYKVSDTGDGYALLRPTSRRETRRVVIARQPIEVGKKYYAYTGEYQEQDKVAVLPVTVTGKAVGTNIDAYSFKATALYNASAPIGSFAADDSKMAVAMVTEDPSDAGSLLLLTNESLVAFAEAHGIGVSNNPTSEPSATESAQPTTEPSTSAEPTESASPSASATEESPEPSATANTPATTASPAPPVSNDSSTPLWVKLLPVAVGLIVFGIVGLVVLLIVTAVRRSRRNKRAREDEMLSRMQAAARNAVPQERNEDETPTIELDPITDDTPDPRDGREG